MQVRWIDARAPGRRRMACAALAAAAAGVLHAVPLRASPGRSAVEYLLLALACVAPFFVRERVESEIHATLVPGALRGRARALVSAAKLAGASVARTERGFAIALAGTSKLRSPPIVEVEREEDARAIREALGVGRAGFGTIAWKLTARGSGRAVVRALAAAFFVTLAGASLVEGHAGGGPELQLAAGLLAVAAVASLLVSLVASWGAPPPAHVTMDAFCASFYEPSIGRRDVPYAELAEVRADATALHVRFVDGGTLSLPVGVPPVIAHHLAAQLRSAMARTRGSAEVAPSLPAPLAVLSRRGEAPREWLAHVDAAAVALARGYRGDTALDAADVGAALADPDAPFDVRAGAARMLARVAPAEATERIRAAIATLHDADERARMRLAVLEDIDTAAGELEALERKRAR